MRFWLVFAGLLMASAALAQLAGPIGNGAGPNFPAGPDFGLVGSLGGVNGGGVTPSSCDGTIDLSTGCAQPMLGGL